MYIEIITTPNEDLKESGFGSQKACHSVLNAIQRMGYSVSLSICSTQEDLDAVAARQPELVILAVKYIPVENGDNIWLSSYFSKCGINYTGSSREVLEFDSNKVLAKTHLIHKGINNTAQYFLAIPGQFKREKDLPISFPLFLKPLDAANGNGIDDLSFVTNFTEYKNKVNLLYNTFKQPVLVEQYLDGREFTVAVIKTRNDELSVSAVEIIPPESSNGLRILGAQAKKDDTEKIVRIRESDIKEKVSALAIQAFNALGVRDFGRIDIKTNEKGECFFMEANLVPGMTYSTSYFPQACDISQGFSYDKVVALILARGLARIITTAPPGIQPGTDKDLVAAVLG